MGSRIDGKYSRSYLDSLYQKLLKRTLAGDRNSFGEAAELISPQLLRRALSILNCTASAQDAVQESLLIAYSQLSTLRDLSKFSPWIHSIVESQCFRIIRQRKKEIHLSKFFEENLLLPTSKIRKMSMRTSASMPLSIKPLQSSLRLNSCPVTFTIEKDIQLPKLQIAWAFLAAR